MEPILVICGPTAVGKSEIALRVAEESGAGILSIDSQQVWQGCDIGTAKPSIEIRKKIPHYLIDVLKPNETFDVSKFQQMADAAIAELQQKKKPIVVAGGAGLYLRVLEFGICDAPGPDPKIREMLNQRPLEVLREELEKIDPTAFHQIHVNDKYRIIRALEVYQQTGKSLSSFQKEHRFASPRYPMKKIGLKRPREELYQRVNQRVDDMMALGWLQEVETLLKQYPPEAKGLQSLGYRELVAHLRGKRSLQEAVELIKNKTRHFAKRQETWFRADPAIQWIHPNDYSFSKVMVPEPSISELPKGTSGTI